MRKLLPLPEYTVSMRALSARPFFESDNEMVKLLSMEDITGYCQMYRLMVYIVEG